MAQNPSKSPANLPPMPKPPGAPENAQDGPPDVAPPLRPGRGYRVRDPITRGADLEHFAVTLSRLLTEHRMTPADLARKMFGSKLDPEGKRIANGADKVSYWLNRKKLPSDQNVGKLAVIFKLDPAILIPSLDPNFKPGSIRAPLNFGPDPADPAKIRIICNNLCLKQDIALKIIAMIYEALENERKQRGYYPRE